jgi:SAM-dependent methyltransferase
MKHPYQAKAAVNHYSKSHVIPHETRSAIAKGIVKSLLESKGHKPKTVRVLDIGPGDGSCFLLPLLDALPRCRGMDIEFQCIDNSSLMLGRLKANLLKHRFTRRLSPSSPITYTRRNIQITLHESDIDNLLCFDNKRKFDVILAPFTLHHLTNWRLVLYDLLHVLKSDGQIFYAERMGDIAYLDGNFSVDSNTIPCQLGQAFTCFRNNIFPWFPEIRASDYRAVSDIFSDSSCQLQIREYTYKYRAKVINWIREQVYTNFWLGLQPSHIAAFISSAQAEWKKTLAVQDGLRTYQAKVHRPKKLAEVVLKSCRINLLSRLRQPSLVSSERKDDAGSRICSELSNMLFLCLANGCFVPSTKWAMGIYWSRKDRTWHRDQPILMFGANALKCQEILDRAKPLQRYYQELQTGKEPIFISDIVFKSQLHKPLIMVRKSRNKVQVSTQWETLVGPQGKRRCKVVTIDVPVPMPCMSQEDCPNSDVQIEDCIIRLRDNWILGNWREFVEKLSKTNSPSESNNSDMDDVRLPKELGTQSIPGRIIQAWTDLLADGLTHIVYVPTEFLVEQENSPSTGFGGIILAENLDCEGAADKVKEHFLIDRAFWCRAIAERLLGQLGMIESEQELITRALMVGTTSIISRNMSHNLGSHVLARHSGGWENKASVQSTVYNLESSTCSPTSSVYDSLEGAIDAVFKKQWTAIKDDQQLDRWLQARMDFVAQVATEWPRWVDSAQLVGEIIWGMLRQRVLLREIVASEGIGSHEWAEDGTTALDGCTGTDEDSKPSSGKAIRLNCCKVSLDSWPKKDEGRTKARALRNGHCILCIPPDGKPTVNLANDIAVAIPGGLTGWHAFYVILENIIRNAAKHQNSGATGKDGAEPLNIYIEILDDSTGKIHIENRPEEAGWPAWLVRVYDNISVLKKGKRLVTTTNDKLNEPIIDASGGLNREHWGLAEMKIAAAYLQRRDLARLGEGGQSVTGNVKAPLHKGTQGSAIIRAIKSPLNTLGYEFFLLKPTRLAIACQSSQAESPNERS